MTRSSGRAGISVAEQLDRYAETQGVLPEELESVDERYRSLGYLTRDQLYEIAEETGHRAIDVGYALFAHDDRVVEGTSH